MAVEEKGRRGRRREKVEDERKRKWWLRLWEKKGKGEEKKSLLYLAHLIPKECDLSLVFLFFKLNQVSISLIIVK